jgi:hypothetical protein
MRSKQCLRQFQRVVGNYDNDAAIIADGGEMSTDSNISSDVGQQATESNNHPERVGNYLEEEVGQKGGQQGRRINDDNEQRR